MRKSFTKIVGRTKHNFQVEADNFHGLIMEEQKFSFPDVYKCGLCGSDNLKLGAHVTKEKKHKYATIRCKDCKATLNFGQQQEDSDVWYLRLKKSNDQIVRDENGYPMYDWKSQDEMMTNE